MSHRIWRAVQASPLSVDHCLPKKIYARMYEIADPINPLRDSDEKHCRALANYLRNYHYNCARGMMMMYVLSAVSLDGATLGAAVHAVENSKLLKDGYCMVLLDGRHPRHCVETVREKNEAV